MSVFFLSVLVRPKSTQVFVGDDVTLICNREGGNKTTQWFINGTQQTHQNYLMLLTAVTPKDNGVYKCEQGGTSNEQYTLSVLGMNTVLNFHDRLLLLRFLMISLSLSFSLSLRAGAVRSALSIIRRCCDDQRRWKKPGAAGGWWSEELVLFCVERSEHLRSSTRCWREDEQSGYICRIKGSRKSHFLVQEKEKWSSKQFRDAEKNRWLITSLR